MDCAAEMFQLLPICNGAVDEISWACKRTAEGRYLQQRRRKLTGLTLQELLVNASKPQPTKASWELTRPHMVGNVLV